MTGQFGGTIPVCRLPLDEDRIRFSVAAKKSGAGMTGATFTPKRNDDELFRAHFRTPFIEPSLVTIDDIGQ